MMARQGSLKVLLHATPLNVSSGDLALYLKEIPSGNTVSLEISFIICKYGKILFYILHGAPFLIAQELSYT